MCCDLTFNTYFESDIESVKKAINEINYRLSTQGEEYVSVNDFYDELGIEHISIGESLGWNIGRDGLIDVYWGTALAKDGRPCVTFEYRVEPRYEYYKSY